MNIQMQTLIDSEMIYSSWYSDVKNYFNESPSPFTLKLKLSYFPSKINAY